RFRVFLAVLGVCVAAGIILSYFEQGTIAGSHGDTGTLEKMIVANGTATIGVDVARLNGRGSSRSTELRFAVGQDSFFTVLVFNHELRGPLPSSMDLSSQNAASLPPKLSASYRQLTIESVPRGGDYE